MATLKEIRKTRIEKLKKLQAWGIPVYPSQTKRTHSVQEVLKNFNKLSRTKKEVILAGRIMALREHGGATFIDIYDGSGENFSEGKIQVILKKDVIGPRAYQLFLDVFDIGDFIETKGTLFVTQRGEKTLQAEDYRMLAKSLLPLPEKWHGLQDIEERLRKRYLDILFNPEVKEMIKKKAVFWNSMREFLLKNGFVEVETPILEVTPGGADARPFITHHNALNLDVYLRISMGELWQKRLMVAGFEKTFEIGRQFRNEGMDAEHLQDYTQMEFYWAYADYKQGMDFVEKMYKYVIEKTFGTLKFKIRGFDIDLSKKWEKYDFSAVISKYTGVNLQEDSLNDIRKKLEKLKIEYDEKGFNRIRAIDSLIKYARKKIAGPAFLINHPIEISPLAKRHEKNARVAQRFQVILAGSENGNGYSELNDPLDQAIRFQEQQKLRERGDEEAQRYDKEFVEALEYGMPPTCGFGVSERLFAFLMDKPVRECQIFPLLKPK